MASLTASSSSYEQEILKFYEQLDRLQQPQKNYNRATTKDTDEFCLEKELEKLKSRTTRSDIYSLESRLSAGAAATASTSIFHTSSPPDIHFQTRVMDETRRARNQEILAKLQELRVNASIFEARAEKFRGIRKEYEDLVQKYSSQRMFTSMSFNGNDEGVGELRLRRVREDFVTKNDARPSNTNDPPLSISTQPLRPALAEMQREIPLMVSTGVNTELSGPVVRSDHEIEDPRVIGINHTRMPHAQAQLLGLERPDMILIPRNESVTPAGVASAAAEKPMPPMPIFIRHNESGDGKPGKGKKGHSYFLHDISSTSESELDLTVTRDKENPNPKSKQVLIDEPEPLSDSLSLSLPTPSISISTKRLNQLLTMTSDSDESSTMSNLNLRLKNKTGGNADVKIRKGKTMAMAGEDDTRLRHSNPNPTTLTKTKAAMNTSSGERLEMLSDSSPTSPSASFIDSNAQNKTPDSVPRDKSTLENIVLAENLLKPKQDRQDDESDGRKKDEGSESDPEGTGADVSKIEKENGFRDDDDRDKTVDVVKAESFKNKVVPSGYANFEKSNLVASLMDELEEDDKEEKSGAVELKENNAKATTGLGDGGESETSKEKSFLGTGTTSVSKPSSSGTIRLKLDYEDSEESEGSERYGRRGVSVTTGNQKTGKDSATDKGKATASFQKHLSDDEDDFFG